MNNTYAYPLSITLWIKVTTSGTYCVIRVKQSTGRIWKTEIKKIKENSTLIVSGKHSYKIII